MSITLILPSGERRTSNADTISIGSAPSCQICIADRHLRQKHAMIRKVAGKWMIEAEEEMTIQVDDGVPARKCWLSDNCRFFLADGVPPITFTTNPVGPVAANAPPSLQDAAPKSQGSSTQAALAQPADRQTTAEGRGPRLPTLRMPRGSRLVIALGIAVLVGIVGIAAYALLGSGGQSVTSLDHDGSISDSVGFVVCGFRATLPDGKQVEVPQATGTCFAVSPDGFLLTNRHVVEETWKMLHAKLALDKLRQEKQLDLVPSVWVFFGSDVKYPADIVHVSEHFDIAVLRIIRTDGTFFRLSTSESLPRGLKVTALGFPGAARAALSQEELLEDARRAATSTTVQSRFKPRDFEFILTSGTVSRVTEESEGRRWIQHNSDINPGNSGGPLVLESGVVVGVNTQGVSSASGVFYSLALPQLRKELSKHIPSIAWH